MAADGFIISFTKPDLGCARPKAFLHLHSISATAHGTLTYSGLVALSSYHLDLTFKFIISTIEGVGDFDNNFLPSSVQRAGLFD